MWEPQRAVGTLPCPSLGLIRTDSLRMAILLLMGFDPQSGGATRVSAQPGYRGSLQRARPLQRDDSLHFRTSCPILLNKLRN